MGFLASRAEGFDIAEYVVWINPWTVITPQGLIVSWENDRLMGDLFERNTSGCGCWNIRRRLDTGRMITNMSKPRLCDGLTGQCRELAVYKASWRENGHFWRRRAKLCAGCVQHVRLNPLRTEVRTEVLVQTAGRHRADNIDLEPAPEPETTDDSTPSAADLEDTSADWENMQDRGVFPGWI